ncbi:hypothetical protein AS033_02040 [Exiguobacterium indicum]|uniref:HNH domain-containing protein n=1 Tax=Exiguobacterium indicum TaxID=296995 RepID=A0A0V8GIU6_9BACL|nr:HNH endonuclease signature motif containing protein [Exiguobacterium enclense]KSU50178.1 hypothetical protein AS033_02040 [Exiguobacterium enclense]SDB90275.1 hypothetical protein SAMN05216342_0420 [Exiguobacterium enclense]
MAFYKSNLISVDNAFNVYENIVLNKHKYIDILYGKENRNECYEKVKVRYKAYEENQLCLEIMTPSANFTTTEKEALLHCYNGKTKVLKDLKDQIIKAQKLHFHTKCTYCGIGDITTMDHYLPKEDFFEFAVHCYNLIPCCSYCNTKKGKSFLDERGDRKIFNPYFENLSADIIIKCEFNFLQEKLIYNISIESSISDNLLISHLETLNIIEKYKDETPRIISSIARELINNFEEYGENIVSGRNALRRNLNDIEEEQSVNSLDAIIRREYIKHDILFDLKYLKDLYSRFKNNAV